jgi:hypothetical protein
MNSALIQKSLINLLLWCPIQAIKPSGQFFFRKSDGSSRGAGWSKSSGSVITSTLFHLLRPKFEVFAKLKYEENLAVRKSELFGADSVGASDFIYIESGNIAVPVNHRSSIH